MIETRFGNVLDIDEGIIVHGCNCQGVMGAGIALEVHKRYITIYDIYREQYLTEGLHLGDITYGEVSTNKYIVNALTQERYGYSKQQVSYDAIKSCFKKIEVLAIKIENYSGYKPEICFPMIGAGRGGGDWDIISNIIDSSISDYFTKALYKITS